MGHLAPRSMVDLPALGFGGHGSVIEGCCAMEAASYLAGEPWTDEPACVCPVLCAFLQMWNDDLSNEDRDRLLRPLVPMVINTRSTNGVAMRRAIAAVDWLVRTAAPEWLMTIGLWHDADAMTALPQIAAIRLGRGNTDAELVTWRAAIAAHQYEDRERMALARRTVSAAKFSASRDARDLAGVAIKASAVDAVTSASKAALGYCDQLGFDAASAIRSAAKAIALSGPRASETLADLVRKQQQSAGQLVHRMIEITEVN